jgi:hypothetical protein
MRTNTASKLRWLALAAVIGSAAIGLAAPASAHDSRDERGTRYSRQDHARQDHWHRGYWHNGRWHEGYWHRGYDRPRTHSYRAPAYQYAPGSYYYR